MDKPFHDLYVQWSTDKHEISTATQIRVRDLLATTDYSTVIYNHSVHSKSFSVMQVSGLKRITVKNEITAILAMTDKIAEYDLVAARPRDEQEFNFCCVNADLDVISIKIKEKMGFRIKLNLVLEAIRRGIMFELCYASALKDINARRFFIGNATNLIRACKGRNIILSSGCKDVYDQRSPYDVINLGCVLGLTQDQAHSSITKNCIQSLQHAQVRRVFKSTVQVMTKQEFLNRNTEGWESLPSNLTS
jgi:ribonuclease P/MRP protein subunit RPP1